MDQYTLGILAAFATVFSWSFGTLSFTKASRLVEPSVLNKFRLMLAVVALTIIASVVTQQNPLYLFTSPRAQSWIWLGLSGIIGLTIGDYFVFTAFKILGAARGSMFSTISPAAALITGYLMLDERISLIGFMGMSVTMFGIMWLLSSREQKEQAAAENHGNYTKGIVMGIASACCQGIGLVMAKKGMMDHGERIISPIDATWIRMLMAFGSIYLIDVIRRKDVWFIQPIVQHKEAIKYILMGTLFGPVIGVALSLLAASSIDVSVAQTILSLVPMIVFPLSALLYKTPFTLKMLLSVLIAIAGVMVLIWQDRIITLLG